MRYWFRLHEVSSHPQGLLALCILFERLLQRHEPQLWMHFKVMNVQPYVKKKKQTFNRIFKLIEKDEIFILMIISGFVLFLSGL